MDEVRHLMSYLLREARHRLDVFTQTMQEQESKNCNAAEQLQRVDQLTTIVSVLRFQLLHTVQHESSGRAVLRQFRRERARQLGLDAAAIQRESDMAQLLMEFPAVRQAYLAQEISLGHISVLAPAWRKASQTQRRQLQTFVEQLLPEQIQKRDVREFARTLRQRLRKPIPPREPVEPSETVRTDFRGDESEIPTSKTQMKRPPGSHSWHPPGRLHPHPGGCSRNLQLLHSHHAFPQHPDGSDGVAG